MADPDLQIRGGGGGGAGGGHPDHEIRGWPGLKKFFFRPFGPHFGLKIKGDPGPPGPPLDPPLKYNLGPSYMR